MNGDGFTKLFSSILTSSIWSEDNNTRILWITMLACTDKDGFCQAAVPGLAAIARLTVADTVAALAKLEGPDLFSRTQEHEGRRIEKTDGGWLVLNHAKYRDRDRAEKRREYQADLMRERRAKEAEKALTGANNLLTGANKELTGANPSVSVSVSVSDSVSGEGGVGEGEQSDPLRQPLRVGDKCKPSDLQEVMAYASEITLGKTDAEAFYDHFTSNGWRVGGKSPMRDWKAAMRNWQRNAAKFAPQAKTGSTRTPVIPAPPLLTAEERRAIAEARGG